MGSHSSCAQHEKLQRHMSEALQRKNPLARMVSEPAKQLLSAERMPSTFELLLLEKVEKCHEPGVYIDLVEDTDTYFFWSYVGSATSPGAGLEGRTAQHLDPNYRAAIRKKSRFSYHYNAVDQIG